MAEDLLGVQGRQLRGRDFDIGQPRCGTALP